MKAKRNERRVQHCYSTWGTTYYDEYYGSSAPYPPVHRSIILDVIKRTRCRSLLDAGCGPASLLRHVPGKSIRRFGFDLTQEMVEEAQRILVAQGESPSTVWQGSVLNYRSFSPPSEKRKRQYDALMCCGVLPHIPVRDDASVFRNSYRALHSGGTAIFEARNELFSLFTMNRFSYEFIRDRLIDVQGWVKKKPQFKRRIRSSLEQFQKQFRMDLPPVRKGKKGEPGYDEILSRTHNPLEVKEHLLSVGFGSVDLLFYHYHCVPPLASKSMGRSFIPESLARENPSDWRGMFMASAFLAVATK